jgi:hypothetical protein
MCDYSLHNVKSRPAKVGDKLTTRDFGTGTRGFSASEDANVVVCVRPGTELSFAEEVTASATGLAGWWRKVINHKTAIFRQVNTERVVGHHDTLEFPVQMVRYLGPGSPEPPEVGAIIFMQLWPAVGRSAVICASATKPQPLSG